MDPATGIMEWGIGIILSNRQNGERKKKKQKSQNVNWGGNLGGAATTFK